MPNLSDLGKPCLAQVPSGQVIPIGVLVGLTLDGIANVSFDGSVYQYDARDLFIVDEHGDSRATQQILKDLAR